MAFAQPAYRESLRDTETCLSVRASKLYHMGFRQPVRRSTLADTNERREWRIYAALAHRQHRRIQQFRGTSQYAVKTRIWIVVSVYVLVAVVKTRLDLDASFYTLLRSLLLTTFDKTPKGSSRWFRFNQHFVGCGFNPRSDSEEGAEGSTVY